MIFRQTEAFSDSFVVEAVTILVQQTGMLITRFDFFFLCHFLDAFIGIERYAGIVFFTIDAGRGKVHVFNGGNRSVNAASSALADIEKK